MKKVAALLLFSSLLGGCTKVGFSTQDDSAGSQRRLAAPSIVINQDAAFTRFQEVNLTLQVPSEATEIYITHDPSCTNGSLWQPKVTDTGWVLSQLNETATVYLKARSAAGVESACVSDSIIHDNIPPQMALTPSPDKITNKLTAKFEFSATDANGIEKYECKMLGLSDYENCVSPREYTMASEGDKAFTARAYDKAGNMSDPVSYSWLVDTKAPVVKIDKGPALYVNVQTAKLEFSAVDGGSGIKNFECKIDNGNYTACATAAEFAQLAAGAHVFSVRAYDFAGNVSDPAMHNWSIDLVAPVVMITKYPSNPSNVKNLSFEFTAVDAASGIESVECKIDGGNYESCVSPKAYANLDDGTHIFSVRATDKAGNVAAPVTYMWLIDTVAPAIIFSKVPLANSLLKDDEIVYQIIETGSGLKSVECTLDNLAFACNAMGPALFKNLMAGSHKFTMKATDNASNMSEKSHQWIVMDQQICHMQKFQQPPEQVNKIVDILFVTDTSGSLDAERAAIAAGIDLFVQNLAPDTDYQVGVLLGHGSKSSWAGKLFQSTDLEPVVLKSAQLTLAQIRAGLTKKLTKTVGDSYSDGGEEGLYSLQTALTGKLDLNKGYGFFRPNAALAVVFIADENDICARYPTGVTPVVDGDNSEGPAFIRDCANVTPESVYSHLKNVQLDRALLVSGIVYTGVLPVPSGGENEKGYGYLETIALNNGPAIDMAGTNYAAGLADIGKLVSVKVNLLTKFILNYAPVDPATITVKVDTKSVGHIFNSALNEVQIQEADAGKALSYVDIDYCLFASQPVAAQGQ